MRPSPERAPSVRPGPDSVLLLAPVILAEFPTGPSDGAVGLPNQLLIAWGIGVIAFIALLAGTSVVRPRAPAADPLVRDVWEEEDDDDGGAWRRERKAAAAFEEGRELARHAPPARAQDLTRTMRALDLGDARVTRVDAGTLEVHVAACHSCRTRQWWKGRRGNCAFERGFVTGAFEVVTGHDVNVEEVTCGGRKGACAFRVHGA